MSYNTSAMVHDHDTNVPLQYYNPTNDSYEVTEGSNGSPFVQLSSSNALFNDTLTANTTAQPLTSSQVCSAVIVQNDPSSTNNIICGGENKQTIVVVPGASKEYQVSNVNLVYVETLTGTATVNWEARN